MIEQLKTIREFFKLPVPHSPQDLGEYLAEKSKAVQAAAQLEAMVGEQEPVACAKCHGTGYYDEGHECDDGTMAGGNYVLCDKCAAPVAQQYEAGDMASAAAQGFRDGVASVAQQPQAEPDWINGVPHWSPALIAKVKQMAAELDEPEQPQAEAVPPGYAGVMVWLGDRKVVRVTTKTRIQHEIEPGFVLRQDALQAIEAIAQQKGGV